VIAKPRFFVIATMAVIGSEDNGDAELNCGKDEDIENYGWCVCLPRAMRKAGRAPSDCTQ